MGMQSNKGVSIKISWNHIIWAGQLTIIFIWNVDSNISAHFWNNMCYCMMLLLFWPNAWRGKYYSITKSMIMFLAYPRSNLSWSSVIYYYINFQYNPFFKIWLRNLGLKVLHQSNIRSNAVLSYSYWKYLIAYIMLNLMWQKSFGIQICSYTV